MGEFYLAHEYGFAAFQLVMAMLGMGAALTTDDFRKVVSETKAVTAGTLVQMLVIPAFAWAFISVLGLGGGIAIAVALIVAIPGGTTSNIFTFFARGNFALSICITGVTTLACLLTTPIVLSVLISEYMPADFVMPRMMIMQEIALTLLLPLIIGMLYRHFIPNSAELFSKSCIRASLLGILLIVIGSSASGRLDYDVFGQANMNVILMLTATLALVAWIASRLVRLNKADTMAVTMEVVVRNVSLGLMIKASLLPASSSSSAALGDTVLFALLMYGGVQMLVAAVLIFMGRRGGGLEAAA